MLCRRCLKMCQWKRSGNAIDIPRSSEATGDCFQMKTRLFQKTQLFKQWEQKHRNKAVFNFTVAQLILTGLRGVADESADEGWQPFKASHAISPRKWKHHQHARCLITPGIFGNPGVRRSGACVVLEFIDATVYVTCTHACTHAGSTSAFIQHPARLCSLARTGPRLR